MGIFKTHWMGFQLCWLLCINVSPALCWNVSWYPVLLCLAYQVHRFVHVRCVVRWLRRQLACALVERRHLPTNWRFKDKTTRPGIFPWLTCLPWRIFVLRWWDGFQRARDLFHSIWSLPQLAWLEVSQLDKTLHRAEVFLLLCRCLPHWTSWREPTLH